MKFSVLLAVYKKDHPEWLWVALNSVLEQSLKPSEIVLVEDGQLTKDLYDCIERFKVHTDVPFRILKLEKNMGTAVAFAKGVEFCSHEWIARMDADDIALPDRFKIQADFISQNENIVLIGGQIAEFTDSPDKIISIRRVPLHHNDILKFAKHRSPFNHVTVMYKKSAVIAVGNYKYATLEDYFLWVRLILKGYSVANIPEVLVKARIKNMVARRRGWAYFKLEIVIQRRLYELGFLNKYEAFRNICIRGGARLLPTFIMKVVYNVFLRG